jgi:hypothetical protein
MSDSRSLATRSVCPWVQERDSTGYVSTLSRRAFARALLNAVASRTVAKMVGESILLRRGGSYESSRGLSRKTRLLEPPVNIPLMMTFSLGTPAARAMASMMVLLAMPEMLSISHVMLLSVRRTLMRLAY